MNNFYISKFFVVILAISDKPFFKFLVCFPVLLPLGVKGTYYECVKDKSLVYGPQCLIVQRQLMLFRSLETCRKVVSVTERFCDSLVPLVNPYLRVLPILASLLLRASICQLSMSWGPMRQYQNIHCLSTKPRCTYSQPFFSSSQSIDSTPLRAHHSAGRALQYHSSFLRFSFALSNFRPTG